METIIGKSVKRIEDLRLLQGQGIYLDDLKIDNALYMMVVRSTQAHATIEAVNTSEAKTINGVVAVITADDIKDLPDLPGDSPKGGKVVHHPLLAKDTVHYVGQPIALILAKSKMAAEDAALAVR